MILMWMRRRRMMMRRMKKMKGRSHYQGMGLRKGRMDTFKQSME